MKKRFSVIETFHDYRLIDNVTGRSACMGDGVDIEGFVGGFAEVGEPGFVGEWEDDANENVMDYLEAYFWQPEVTELDGFTIERRSHARGTNLADETAPVTKVSKGARCTLMTQATILCMDGKFTNAIEATDEEIVDALTHDESVF